MMLEATLSEIRGRQGSAHDMGAYEYIENSTSSIKADAGKDQTICEGNSATLTASGGTSYKWSTGETTASITVNPTQTTTYSVEVSDGTSSDTDEVVVAVEALPTAEAGSDITINQGESTTLTAAGGDTYLWSTGDTTASITVNPTQTTNYEVTVTKNGCSSTDTVRVTVSAPAPPTGTVTADAGKDQTICEGNSATLTASGGTSYQWSTGETTASITVNPTQTTTYSVEVSDGTSSDTDEVVVAVEALPTAEAGSDITINQGESTTLTATGGDTYLWSTGDTTASITVNPTQTTNYEVTVTKNGCSSTDTVRVTVSAPAPPTGTVTADAGKDQTICEGNSATLTASGGTSYQWSTGETTASITVNPTQTTTYSVEVSDGTSSDTDEVVVAVEALPTAEAGSDITINQGESTTLTATGGDTYLWSTGDTTASITVNPTQTTNYEVTVTKNGCSSTDTVRVTVSAPAPPTGTVTADAGKDQTICEGNSATLTASGGTSYQWSTGETTASITVNPTQTTTYSVEVSDGTSSDTDEVVVAVEALPTAEAGSDITINQGESTTLTAAGGDTYLWSTGDTTASITVNPTQTTNYEVTVTKNGCSSTDTVRVTVSAPAPPTGTVTADAGKDQTICEGNSATLTASGGTSYQWSTGETTASITVNPTQTTTYSVEVSDGTSSDTDEVVVAVEALPTAEAGSDITINQGESTTLTATGGDTYLWSTGDTTASITVNPTQTTNYEVTVTKNGCSSTDTVRVTVSAPAPPTGTVTADAGKDQTICEGNSATLTASGGTSYQWSTGETTASITVNPTQTTTYSVEVSDGTSSDTDEVVVTVNSAPQAKAGSNRTIKQGETVVLSASGGESYLWNTGEITPSISVSPNTTTVYSVLVSSNGCTSTDQVKVSVVKPLPPADANAGSDLTICKGESITLSGSGGEGYLWSTGEEDATIVVSPDRTTTYTLQATRGGVTDTDEVVVTVINCDLNNEVNNSVSNTTGNTTTNTPAQDSDQILNKTTFDLTVYPNPTEGKINVQTTVPIYNFNLVLMNINGNVIYSDEMDAREDGIDKEIDLSRFAKGVYLLQLYNAEESYVRKVIVI